jgi:hypothetical protein
MSTPDKSWPAKILQARIDNLFFTNDPSRFTYNGTTYSYLFGLYEKGDENLTVEILQATQLDKWEIDKIAGTVVKLTTLPDWVDELPDEMPGHSLGIVDTRIPPYEMDIHPASTTYLTHEGQVLDNDARRHLAVVLGGTVFSPEGTAILGLCLRREDDPEAFFLQ